MKGLRPFRFFLRVLASMLKMGVMFKKIFAGACALYLVFALHYYYTQTRLFDPFLQMPPAPLPESLEKPAGTIRVLTLGGSTTRNGRLPFEQRYPTLLEQYLQERFPDMKIEVLNAGMDWYTTRHSLITYTTMYRKWKPDLVIVMHAINDLYRSFSPPDRAVGDYKSDWSHFYGASINGAKPPTFEEHILAIQLTPTLERWFYSLIFQPADFPLETYVSLPSFRENLETLSRYIAADGVPVVLMSQPYLLKEEMPEEELRVIWFGMRNCYYKPNPVQKVFASHDSLTRAMAAYNRTTRSVATETGGYFFDAEPVVPKTLEYFIDDVHYTAKATDLIAKNLAEFIVSANILNRKGS